MGDATEKVAGKFPDMKFAIIDSSAAGMKSKPTNVEGLLFSEQEAGYLVGYLAGLYAKDNNVKTIGSVGGQKIPPVDHYIAGYQAGAKKANPGIKTLNAYSQDFVDQAKCKEIALNQIAKGSKVVFQVAGQCGLGVLDAAKEKSMQGIGVDADQAYLGPQVLTSALKKVDVAVVDAIKGVQDGQVHGRRRTSTSTRRSRRHRASASSTPAAPEVRRRRSSRSEEGQIAAGKISEQSRTTVEQRRHRTLRCREAALELRGITKRFGALIVANDASTSTCARRGPRAARRERRRQVDADERPLRALHARRGRDPRRRPARQHRLAAARRSSSGSAWCTSTSCSSRS